MTAALIGMVVLTILDGLLFVIIRKHWRQLSSAPFIYRTIGMTFAVVLISLSVIIVFAALGTPGTLVAFPAGILALESAALFVLYELHVRSFYGRRGLKAMNERREAVDRMETSRLGRRILRLLRKS